MQGENNISSCLLLILLGIAIYLLLNPKSFNLKLTNSGACNMQRPKEPFEDIGLNTQSNNVTMEFTDKNKETKPDQHMQQYNSVPITEYVNDTSNIVENNSDVTSNMQSVMPEQYNPTPTTNEKQTIFNFNGTDESVFNTESALLTDAFALPLPQGTDTTAVDFKKNNMDNFNARDFLPKEINDEWFETDFSLAKYQLNDDKLINTDRYIIGINTVGQSLKNATWDIRGTISNPKFVVSPFNNSTYEPDFNLKPLC